MRNGSPAFAGDDEGELSASAFCSLIKSEGDGRSAYGNNPINCGPSTFVTGSGIFRHTRAAISNLGLVGEKFGMSGRFTSTIS